jgi:hypothetical protein
MRMAQKEIIRKFLYGARTMFAHAYVRERVTLYFGKLAFLPQLMVVMSQRCGLEIECFLTGKHALQCADVVD